MALNLKLALKEIHHNYQTLKKTSQFMATIIIIEYSNKFSGSIDREVFFQKVEVDIFNFAKLNKPLSQVEQKWKEKNNIIKFKTNIKFNCSNL